MEKITLSGSFFLFPGNKVWKKLENNYKIEFYDYGNLGGALSNTPEKECLVLIIFFNQLLEDLSLPLDELKNRITPLMSTAFAVVSYAATAAGSIVGTIFDLNKEGLDQPVYPF